MSINFLVSSFYRFAGPNNHILDLCNYLYNDMNCDIKLITQKMIMESNFSQSINFPFYPILYGENSLTKRMINLPTNLLLLNNFLNKQHINHEKIFVNSGIDLLLLSYIINKNRIVVGYNMFDEHKSLLQSFCTRYLTSKIFAHSKFQKSIYKSVGIDKNKIIIVPHCISIKRIEKYITEIEKNKDEFIIFYGGSLHYLKGIRELLYAYEEICKKIPCKLLIVGDGPHKEWIINEINRKQLKNIELIDKWIPQNKFINEMNKADVVVLPCHQQAFGLVILEAMILKKIIITTYIGGPKEIIKNEYNGYFVEPKNVESLVNKILYVYNNTKTNEIGLNAYLTVKKLYDVKIVAPLFLKNFNS